MAGTLAKGRNRQSQLGNQLTRSRPARSPSRACPSISRLPEPINHPSAALRDENRQFFHHELSLTECANHARAGSGIPLFRHLFARMTTPALAISMLRECVAIDFRQIAVVQPGFTGAIDVVAVIEHETSAVRVAEIFEIHDLHPVSRLAIINVIDDLLARAKPDQIDIKFVANRVNETDQVLVLLFCAVLIALTVNEPRDLRIRA